MSNSRHVIGGSVRRLLAVVVAFCSLAVLSVGPAVAADGDKRREAAMGALRMANLHYQEGRFRKAAELYHDAFNTYPEAAFLFNAARAEMRDFQLDRAERDFRRYLELPGVDASGQRRAQVHLEEIAAYRRDAAAKSDAAAAAAAAAMRANSRGKDGLSIGLWVGGGSLLVTGAVLYGVAYVGRLATNDMQVADAAAKSTHDADVSRQASLRNGAVVAALVGAGLCGWAAQRRFFAASDAASTATSLWLLPRPGGAQVGIGGAF